ncbi:hypothetical protein Srufu_013780 [Streptomyces libani subsp. rufus]|nr:hypothetical protein Srufu_013780 [Streptomyces libani subsp. rufus]
MLTDPDLSRERLIVRRPGKRHIIYLDELSYRCASAWLRERHREAPTVRRAHSAGGRSPLRIRAPRPPTPLG